MQFLVCIDIGANTVVSDTVNSRTYPHVVEDHRAYS